MHIEEKTALLVAHGPGANGYAANDEFARRLRGKSEFISWVFWLVAKDRTANLAALM